MGSELPDSPQLPRPLPILHEEGPTLLQGRLCPAQDQKKPEEAIIPNEMRGTCSESRKSQLKFEHICLHLHTSRVGNFTAKSHTHNTSFSHLESNLVS